MSEQDASSDQHPEPSEVKKEPDKTFCRAFWRRATIYGTAIVIAACIAPSIRFDNEAAARFGLAAATVTLFAFIDLLIYLFAYKEELSGFIFKIFNAIKNFPLYVWEKINYVKKFFKPFCIFVGLTLLIAAELFLIHKTFEGFNNHATEIRNLPNEFNFSLKSDKLSKIQDIRFNTFLCAIGVLFLPALPAAFFAKKIKSMLEKHILRTFVVTVIFGGILAFLIPTFLYNYGFIGDTKDLTTALLGVTGGVVALFSLIKSHQKSELEREQLEVQKQKDSRDHIRQLYNSYSDRFDKAVTELNNKKDKNAAFAAVYKLSHLADDWLDFKDLTNTEKDFQKLEDKANAEVQTIINVFCKYIRSMPDGYSHSKLKDGDVPEEDVEIRRLIFSEISSRCSKVGYNSVLSRGQWSDFDFDFSTAPIFYSLAELTFDDANFSHATFYKDSSFKETKFAKNAIFENANFLENANFFATKFIESPSFDKAYISNSNFKSFFFRGATFEDTKFANSAIFEKAEFTGIASFHGAIFGYSQKGYDHKFTANFINTKFYGPAVFEYAQFSGRIDFSKADFQTIYDSRHDISNLSCDSGSASFYSALFFGKTLFNLSSFDVSCNFINAKFFNDLSFKETYFKFSPTFNNSYFSHRIKYDFKNIDQKSKSQISTGLAVIKLKNGTLESQSIPKKSCLFDTRTWNKKKNTALCVSPPA